MQIEHGLPKERVTSEANYAPWCAEAGFVEDHAKVSEDAAVDIFRQYELWKLASQLAHIPGDILEVGVWRGSTGILLKLAADRFLKGRTVHLCDTFKGVVKAGPYDSFFKGGEFANTSADFVRLRCERNSLVNIEIHEGIFPEETGDVVTHNRFCMAHIDVDVYESAKDVFNWVWPRLSVGGVVVFDDYGWVECAGVIKFVNEELFGRNDCLVIHNLNGHAVVIKKSP